MDQKERCAKLASPVFWGIAIAFFAFSLPFMQVLITFGQLENGVAAVLINLLILAVTLFSALAADRHYYRRCPYRNAFAVSYFASCLLWAGFSFLFAQHCDFSLLYGSRAEEADSVFRLSFLQFAGLNAATLLVRLGLEFRTYLRSGGA